MVICHRSFKFNSFKGVKCLWRIEYYFHFFCFEHHRHFVAKSTMGNCIVLSIYFERGNEIKIRERPIFSLYYLSYTFPQRIIKLTQFLYHLVLSPIEEQTDADGGGTCHCHLGVISSNTTSTRCSRDNWSYFERNPIFRSLLLKPCVFINS